MHKKIYILILLLLSSGMGSIVFADEYLQLPIERLGQNVKQKEQNLDASLFQNDKFGDLKEQRLKREEQRRKAIFVTEKQQVNKKIELFKQPLVLKNPKTKKFQAEIPQFGIISLLVITCGIGISIYLIVRSK